MECKQFSAAIGAIKEIGVLSGQRVERKEVGPPGAFDELSDDQLERALTERFCRLPTISHLTLIKGREGEDLRLRSEVRSMRSRKALGQHAGPYPAGVIRLRRRSLGAPGRHHGACRLPAWSDKKLDVLDEQFGGLRRYLYEIDPQFDDEREAWKELETGTSLFGGMHHRDLRKQKEAEGRRTLKTNNHAV
jgi:hypothetical protein